MSLPEPLALSIAEACSVARAGRTALYEAIRSGALRAVKRGRRTIVLADDIPKDVITDCDNGDCLCRLLGYFGREIARCKNDVHFQTDQLGGQLENGVKM